MPSCGSLKIIRAFRHRAKTLLESEVDLLLSIATLWEIAIKTSIGKLTLSQPFDVLIPQQLTVNVIEILPINLAHLSVVSALSFHHRDPFDRLLIAQAMIEQLPIISADATFDLYGVRRFW